MTNTLGVGVKSSQIVAIR